MSVDSVHPFPDSGISGNCYHLRSDQRVWSGVSVKCDGTPASDLPSLRQFTGRVPFFFFCGLQSIEL